MDIMGHDQPLLCCIFVVEKCDGDSVNSSQKGYQSKSTSWFRLDFFSPRVQSLWKHPPPLLVLLFYH
jgi:hypothetical protein